MCGIFGYFLFNKNAYRPNLLREMADTIPYRGPNDEGFFEDRDHGIGLGNKRLSIIDLDHGRQPFHSSCGKISVVQNGEIFNYIELMEDLKREGVSFKTASDTEVILRLYEKYGIDFPKYLNGMFAVALYDERVKKLFLIRDRAGVKPLYFYKDQDKLYFSSEIKTILKGDISRKINNKSLSKYFTFNYVPSPETIFENVCHIKPGHYLEISDAGIQDTKWWHIKNEAASYKAEADIIDEFNSILKDAVRIRMRSDVPFGAFLSGGVDSSTVVGLMSQFSSSPIQTFSIGFHDERFDETPYAEEAAALFGTLHRGNKVDKEIVDLWKKVIYHCDQPHGDTSFIPTYIVSKLASESVKVVLTGDGGDELFGGYLKYKNFLERTNQEKPCLHEYARSISVFKPEDWGSLFSPQLNRELFSFNPYDFVMQTAAEANHMDFINQMLYLDFSMLLPGNNLVKPDRMGMAASIEARNPFMDYRMIEFSFKIRGDMKIRDGETKYIYKKAVKGLIGDNLAYRKKQMFTVPMGEWLKSTLKNYSQDVLFKESYIQNYLNMDYVKKLVDDHLSGSDRTREVRQIVALEHWCHNFLD